MEDSYYKKYLINKNSESSYQNDIYKIKYYKYKEKYLDLKNNVTCIAWQKNYLKNVCIYSNDQCLNLCQNTSFLKQIFSLDSFYNLKETENTIRDLDVMQNDDDKNKELQLLKKKWKKCDKDCFDKLYKLIQNEIHSTAYILRLISNSIITTENGILQFEYNNQRLTGFWEDDFKNFKIKKLGNNITNRLIFGFGPSASGKTFWAENIIKLFSKNNKNFPKTFLSIDGGLYRELSETYQYIINNLNKNNIGGFYNLVTAGLGGSKSLFKSSKIKKSIINFLENQSNISLYVPITLGGCYKSWCLSEYRPYINIVKDPKWIGLLIYQHKTGLDCPYRNEFRCVGCTESGIDRETKEGKKYSSTAYNMSMNNGLIAIKNAPGGIFEIHNSGGFKYKNSEGKEVFSKSIFKEYPINDKYIFDNISDEFNSIYLQV